MLFLLFQLGGDRYALEAAQVVEVLPLVSIKRIPRAPAGIAGALNYRGAPVPVIDLNELATGRPAAARLSTRIILVNYIDSGGSRRVLGLIAEQATQMLRRDPGDFASTGIRPENAPYLGPVVADERGMIQWVEVNQLLPDPVQNLLFQEPLPG
ncbi:MAG TPA: chemotaxis protein CheW [Verrucomicrobiae bacterium]|nr:chemotaxis protein CheW [Verrucomicrobiae bacterium]